jgi:transposase
MAKARTLVGLDVHATKIVAAVLDADSGELRTFGMNGDAGEAAGFCAGLPRPVRVAYEAGPTGYGLARELSKRRVECVVAAPSKIPRASGDRVKTDRRDAEHLVRLLLAGKLHAVRVPGPEEEALRDLVRAREGVRVDLMRCRHRLSKLLLRHGIRFDDGPAWTQRHRDWLAQVALEWPAAQATLLDAQGAIDALCHRRDGLEREIVALVPRLAVGGAGRSVAVPARGRHADRGRVVRGGRRLRAVRTRRAADELRRPGPVRVNDRAAAPARVDHEDRLRARPPTAGRGLLALSPASADRQGTD